MKLLLQLTLLLLATNSFAVLNGGQGGGGTGIGKITIKKDCSCAQDSVDPTNCKDSCRGFKCWKYIIGPPGGMDSCNCYNCDNSAPNFVVPVGVKKKAVATPVQTQ